MGLSGLHSRVLKNEVAEPWTMECDILKVLITEKRCVSVGFFSPKGSGGMRSHSASSKFSSILEIYIRAEVSLLLFLKWTWGSGAEGLRADVLGCQHSKGSVWVQGCAVQSFLDDLISSTTRKRAGFSWYDHIRACVGVWLREFWFLGVVDTLHCKLRICCLFSLPEQRKGLHPLGAGALQKQSMFLKEGIDLF